LSELLSGGIALEEGEEDEAETIEDEAKSVTAVSP
jgi:hypothetical protein